MPTLKTLDLYALMDDFSEAFFASIPEFKESAMTLIEGGADPTIQLDMGSKATILHLLLMTNKDNVNIKEINQLLSYDANLIQVKDGHGRTLFQHLLEEGLERKQCELSVFRQSSLFLAKYLTVSEQRSILKHFIDSNVYSECEQEIKQLLALNPSLSIEQLNILQSIQDMHDYGSRLKQQNEPKGQMIIEHADQLKKTIVDFFEQDLAVQRSTFDAFQHSFMKALHSKDKEMSQYRVSWTTISANIAIALTGIGVVPILGQLLYSKVTTGRFLFFGQKQTTTSEDKINAIEDMWKCNSSFC